MLTEFIDFTQELFSCTFVSVFPQYNGYVGVYGSIVLTGLLYGQYVNPYGHSLTVIGTNFSFPSS